MFIKWIVVVQIERGSVWYNIRGTSFLYKVYEDRRDQVFLVNVLSVDLLDPPDYHSLHLLHLALLSAERY